jgi:hypothetical protein
MARAGFEIEKLLSIVAANSDTGAQVLVGSGAPGGDTDEQDDSPIGSLYLRDSGVPYFKVTDTNAAADWFTYDDLYTIVGLSKGSTDFGTFTGNILSDNASAKTLFQELESFIEANLSETVSGTGVTTEVTVDTELVDDVCAVEYDVCLSLDSNPAQKRIFKVYVSNDGTASSDATETDETVFAKLKHGAAFNYVISTDVSGTGAAQVMNLKLSASAAISYSIRRVIVVPA